MDTRKILSDIDNELKNQILKNSHFINLLKHADNDSKSQRAKYIKQCEDNIKKDPQAWLQSFKTAYNLANVKYPNPNEKRAVLKKENTPIANLFANKSLPKDPKLNHILLALNIDIHNYEKHGLLDIGLCEQFRNKEGVYDDKADKIMLLIGQEIADKNFITQMADYFPQQFNKELAAQYPNKLLDSFIKACDIYLKYKPITKDSFGDYRLDNCQPLGPYIKTLAATKDKSLLDNIIQYRDMILFGLYNTLVTAAINFTQEELLPIITKLGNETTLPLKEKIDIFLLSLEYNHTDLSKKMAQNILLSLKNNEELEDNFFEKIKMILSNNQNEQIYYQAINILLEAKINLLENNKAAFLTPSSLAANLYNLAVDKVASDTSLKKIQYKLGNTSKQEEVNQAIKEDSKICENPNILSLNSIIFSTPTKNRFMLDEKNSVNEILEVLSDLDITKNAERNKTAYALYYQTMIIDLNQLYQDKKVDSFIEEKANLISSNNNESTEINSQETSVGTTKSNFNDELKAVLQKRALKKQEQTEASYNHTTTPSNSDAGTIALPPPPPPLIISGSLQSSEESQILHPLHPDYVEQQSSPPPRPQSNTNLPSISPQQTVTTSSSKKVSFFRVIVNSVISPNQKNQNSTVAAKDFLANDTKPRKNSKS